MNFRKLLPFTTAVCGLVLGACVHTPPGTSVQVALAQKAALVRLPGPPPAMAQPERGGPAVHVPAVEPELPLQDAAQEAYSQGLFCMEVGKEPEAIAAFEQAVKVNPNYEDAWQNLVVLYEKAGQPDKALESLRQLKKLAKH